MPRLPRLPVVLGLLLVATSARADILPDGYKGVRLSIKVDAEVPAGKALILANTFRGADVITPGEVQKVEWHPLGGQMQLRLVDAADTATLLAARENLDRDTIRPIADKAAKCGDEIEGVRTVPESEPYDEVRWIYRVTFDGTGCKAERTGTEHLKNEAVDEPPAPPPASEPAAADPPKPASPETAAAAKTGDAGATAAKGCGCSSGGEAPGLAMIALGLVGLAGRRRRG